MQHRKKVSGFEWKGVWKCLFGWDTNFLPQLISKSQLHLDACAIQNNVFGRLCSVSGTLNIEVEKCVLSLVVVLQLERLKWVWLDVAQACNSSFSAEFWHFFFAVLPFWNVSAWKNLRKIWPQMKNRTVDTKKIDSHLEVSPMVEFANWCKL